MPHIKNIIKFDNADNREYPETQLKTSPVTAQKRLVTPNNFLGYLGILSILTQHTQNTISAFWVFWGSSSRRGLFELPRYPESGTYEKKATGFIWVFSPKYPNTQNKKNNTQKHNPAHKSTTPLTHRLVRQLTRIKTCKKSSIGSCIANL